MPLALLYNLNDRSKLQALRFAFVKLGSLPRNTGIRLAGCADLRATLPLRSPPKAAFPMKCSYSAAFPHRSSMLC